MATRKKGETGTGDGAAKKGAAGGRAAGTKAKDTAASPAKAGAKTAGGKTGTKAGGKAGGKTGGAKTGAKGATTRARGGGAAVKPNLQKDLREFVQAHPGGWGHNEWIGLVNLLRDRGHDTSDTDAIGMALERERLTLVLERVPGLGPQRVKAIADKYPRLWNLMQANAEEIAAAANVPKTVANKVKEALP